MQQGLVEAFIIKYHPKALGVFWANNVIENPKTKASKLHVVIIYGQLPNTYCEAFTYEGCYIDTDVHDKDTLRYVFKSSQNESIISELMHTIIHGKHLEPLSDFSESIRSFTAQFFKKNPGLWDKKTMDKKRFFITNTLRDIQSSSTHIEQLTSIRNLYVSLPQFYFRTQNKWSPSDRLIIEYFKQEDLALAQEFVHAFEVVLQTGNTDNICKLTKKILNPYGGLLWDGYKEEAPKEEKWLEKISLGLTVKGNSLYLEEAYNIEVDTALYEGMKAHTQSAIGIYARNPYTIYIESVDGGLIGGCNGNITRNICYIERIWVAPNYRRNRFGLAILEQLENYAKAKNCNTINLHTGDFQGKSFYEKCGYSVVSSEEWSWFPGHKQLMMSKSL